MTSINFHIQGTDLNKSINVETMYKRLSGTQDRLQKQLAENPDEAQQLHDRLEKVNNQIDRLNKLKGKDIEISSARAMEELHKGSNFVNQGLSFLANHSEQDSDVSSDQRKLLSWSRTINRWQDKIDTYG